MRGGPTAQRLEGALVSVSQKLGLECEPMANPTGMVLAFSDAATAAALRDGPGHSPEMAAMLACRYRPSLPVTEPLRDDFAPVERFALSLLRRP